MMYFGAINNAAASCGASVISEGNGRSLGITYNKLSVSVMQVEHFTLSLHGLETI